MPGEYDPFKYRIPRAPMLIIFRQGAPRAQTFQAELLQKDVEIAYAINSTTNE